MANGDPDLADDHDLVGWAHSGARGRRPPGTSSRSAGSWTTDRPGPGDPWWARPADPSIELDQARPDDVALLAFTSGTTGRPKGVPLTHANLLAGAEALRRAWAWTPDDRLILALPLFHMHGLGVGVHGTLLAGASAALFERFEPETVLHGAARTRGDHVLRRPHHVRPAGRRSRRRAPGGACACACRARPRSAPSCTDASGRDRPGGARALRHDRDRDAHLQPASTASDGPAPWAEPLPGVDLRLDPDNDEIQVRGPNVFAGYLDDPEANRAAFTDDGWFRTGDIGRLDDGYLRIVGRAKDLIITGGYNVYPAEIEEVLRGHPAVADAAVAGLASPEWGEIVGAWLELDPAGPPLDLDELRRWCAERLVPYKRPRHLQVVDALPRNALGKVQRQQLTPPP